MSGFRKCCDWRKSHLLRDLPKVLTVRYISLEKHPLVVFFCQQTEGNFLAVCKAAGKKDNKYSFREEGMSVFNVPELFEQR